MEKWARPLAWIEVFLKRGERREFEQKDEINIVSLTLRECLGLSFQGIYIYLFIIIIFHLISSHCNSRGEIEKGAAAKQGHPTGNFEKKTYKQQRSVNKVF